jgi:hypothetical protein
MKTTLAILFSLMLAWMQGIPACLLQAAPADVVCGPCCDPCACAASCCVESSESNRPPTAPPLVIPGLQGQMLQPLCRTMLEVRSLDQIEAFAEPALVDTPFALPLYIRHCAYLI